MILYQLRTILHNPRNHSIYIVHICLNQRPNSVLNVGHVLLINQIFPEKQVLLPLESLMLLTANQPGETYFK